MIGFLAGAAHNYFLFGHRVCSVSIKSSIYTGMSSRSSLRSRRLNRKSSETTNLKIATSLEYSLVKILRQGSTLKVKNFCILGFLMSEYLVSPLIICRKPHLNPIYITIMVTDFKSEITSWNEWRKLRFWPFSQNVV